MDVRFKKQKVLFANEEKKNASNQKSYRGSLVSRQISRFYRGLKDPRFASCFAVIQRGSLKIP